MMHRQWGGFFTLTAIALPVCMWGLRRRGTLDARRLAWIVPVGLLGQVALWLFTTHLQSRFLVPLLVPGSIVLGGAFAALAHLPPALRMRAWIGVAAMFMQVLFTLMVYRLERGGAPAELLYDVPSNFAGLTGLGDDVDSPARNAAITNNPTLYVNYRVLPRDGSIFLLGDAAPFYYVNAVTNEPVNVIYATTWDNHPLAHEIEKGVSSYDGSMVLVDQVMLDVWERSGFADPRLSPQRLDEWRRRQANVVMDWSRIRVGLRQDKQLLRLR